MYNKYLNKTNSWNSHVHKYTQLFLQELLQTCSTETRDIIELVGNVYKLDVSSSRGQSNSVNRGVPLIMIWHFNSPIEQRLFDVLISLKRANRTPKDI